MWSYAFYLQKKNLFSKDAIISIWISKYEHVADIRKTNIITDTYNLTKEEINGRPTYILKEDNQFSASFIYRRTKYSIFTENLDYDKAQKILESMS